MRRVVAVVLLTAMWVALWGDLSAGTAVAGLIAAIAVVTIVPNPLPERDLVFRPARAAWFVVMFVRDLVVSTASVARLVVSPGARDVHGTFITVQLSERGHAVRTIIAHSISLTPGTLTVDVEEDGRTLHVHVIQAAEEQAARASIAALEERAIAAFAPERADLPAEEVR